MKEWGRRAGRGGRVRKKAETIKWPKRARDQEAGEVMQLTDADSIEEEELFLGPGRVAENRQF